MKAKYAAGFRLPGWQFLIGMSLYVELLLYFWNTSAVVPGRLAAIVLFGLAFGSALGLISSFFRSKAEKWVTVVLGAILAVLCLLEHFINDAYHVFMPLISVVNNAQGVATGYFSTIVNLLVKSFWRIALVLLPVILYALFSAGSRSRGWKRSVALLLATTALYGAGVGTVHAVGIDVAQLSAASNFDGTIRSFGLSMAMMMDLTGGAAMGDNTPEFDIPVATVPPLQETEPADPGATEGSDSTDATEPEIVYGCNTYDLDFAQLAQEETVAHIASIHAYVASVPASRQNAYTGLFAGKNLILITAEAFSSQVIDPELTPTLYRMANEGIQFTDYYHPLWGCGTTGGEFANLLGLVPFNGTTVMMETVEQYMFLTMGNQLQRLGYSSSAFHNNDHTFYDRHKTHTNLGYDRFFASGTGMEEILTGSGWPKSDLEMFEGTIGEYLDQPPFSLYYMTVSGHSPYSKDNMVVAKNYDYVKDLPYSEPVKCYLAANLELEFAMASLIRTLEEAGIADDTVIVISTDHYPYGLDSSATWGDGTNFAAELMGVKNLTELVRDNSSLIIWSGCVEDMDIVVDTPVSALDILPTLSNLFGVEYDSRLLIGRDVFSDTEPLVIWPLSYSWKTEKGYYNGLEGKFTPAEGVEVDEGYVERVNALMKNKIVFSRAVQNYDYYNLIAQLLGLSRP